MTRPLLQLSKVTKSFGAVQALRGVSFDLMAGEVHALLGENGAGKSTLIKVISGAHTPDEGSMEVDGRAVADLTPARARALGIACIYQQPALFPDLTVVENIGLRLEQPGGARMVNWGERRRQASQLLSSIGAAIPIEAEIGELSMPEQQLVEIACALGAGARVILMDEPTASLTQREQHLLFAVVRELRQSRVGVLYISHRLEEIFALADRVTVLRDGESLGTTRVDEINETSLIRKMVGREVSQIYPATRNEPGRLVLELRGVSCTTGGVSGVNLQVRAGEVVGLAGLVGAGRTELARILFGITPADSGTILLDGKPVQIRSPREAVEHGIAYVPEDRRRHGVILEMGVAENISLANHRHLFPGGWLRFEAEQALALKFIQELSVKAEGPNAAAGTLSGGNQQKVSIARWLATGPKVLILDEPTQGVDVGAKQEIHRIIRQLADEGLAVLMISSDLPEVQGMSDQIAVMRAGKITAVLPGHTDSPRIMAAALGHEETEGTR
jgi:rhamnose transport system ATP-binding protein